MSTHVEQYERFWMWGATAIIALILGTTIYAIADQGLRPPSHVETIDPRKVMADPRFATRGVTTNPDGSVTVTMVALMFAYTPNEIRVPRGTKVTFRLTSMDVIHGFEIVGTNGNSMIIPGYVSQFSTTFPKAGEYLIVCHEYCGLGHHTMSGKLIVEDR